MVKNPDIVAGVAALKSHRPYVVGFAAETNNVEEYARQKRARKNLDLICANDVSQPNQGFNSDSNALHLFWQDGEKRLPLERKELLGQLLLDEIVTRYDEKNKMAVRAEGDLVARYGGEEFVVVLPGVSLAHATAIAERIQQKIREAGLPHAASAVASEITVSIGIVASDGTVPIETLIARADSALYQAKNKGRNQWSY